MIRGSIAIVLALLVAGHLNAGPVQAGTREGRDAFLRADFATALKELSPQAEKDDPEAQYYLGKMYQAGLGAPKDVARGVALLGKASEGGDRNAQYYFGIALALGDGVEQDLVEGLKWMYVAARMGNDDAEAYLRKLRMPREVLAAARRAAYKWHAGFLEKEKEKGEP